MHQNANEGLYSPSTPLQRNSSLPDDTNVARLQEELIGVKLREAEALTSLKELRQQVRDLEEHWQVGSNSGAPEQTSDWKGTRVLLRSSD